MKEIIIAVSGGIISGVFSSDKEFNVRIYYTNTPDWANSDEVTVLEKLREECDKRIENLSQIW